jgi:DNA-binding NtrC family response regulator
MYDTTVLLLGRDRSVTSVVCQVVTEVQHCRFEGATTVRAARARLQRGGVGLALVYLHQANDPALEFVRSCRSLSAAPPTLVLCERYDADLMLQLLQWGAVDCLARPFNLSRLALLVDVLTVRARYAGAVAVSGNGLAAVEAAEDGDALDDFVVVSPALMQIKEQVRRVAPLDCNILLTGETGTGKTRLARLIHDRSPRKVRPFLSLNCGALSPTLIESEMFGHVRGAFTGADTNHTGKFEQVGDGTLLLDEIDSLPVPLQGKLLRAVEERLFEPVGSNQSRPVRARLIAATNRSLEEEVAAGRFRSDLYFRLNVVGLHLPPLRERRHAIAPLAEKYLAQFAHRYDRPVPVIEDDALEALQTYEWPGNIRELRNVIERAVALCDRPTLAREVLFPAVQRPGLPERAELTAAGPATNRLAEARTEAERERLVEALRTSNNNRSQAALQLGISRVTLYKKLHKYHLA